MMSRAGLFTLFLVASTSSAADWPQWLGPRRDGGTPEIVAPWADKPKVVWRQPAGAGFSVPVVAGGRVFIHAAVKDKEVEEVVAYDAATGKQLWRDSYERGPYTGAVTVGPQATPAVAGGRVYTYGITGVLSCYQAESGKRLWQINPYKKFGARLPTFGVCSSPLVVGDRIIVAVGGKGTSVVAFDADKGDVVWQVLDEPAATTSPVLLPASNPDSPAPDVVVMTTLRVVGLNPLDGKVNWEYPLAFNPAGTAPTPLVGAGFVVTSTQDNGTVAVRVEATTDKVEASRAWQEKELAGYFSTGVIVGKDQLYLITNKLKPVPHAALRCVDLKTGKEHWNKTGVGYFHAGILRTGDGKLLLLTDSGQLRLIEANAKEFKQLAMAKVCGGTFVAPVLAGGRIYVRDDKEVICLRATE